MLTKLIVTIISGICKSSHCAAHLILNCAVCQLHLNKTGKKNCINS